jgi:hypothetical protein
VNSTVAGNNVSPILGFSAAREVYALQMVVMFVCCALYNESTDVADKCMVVYRTAWI